MELKNTMPKKQTKNFLMNITAILLCVIAVFAFGFFIKADSGGQVQFTVDTIISLSDISDGDLYIRTNSECAEISVSGADLTIRDIPIANNFILKTTSHNNALKLTPSGGILDLTLNSANILSGNITQWTLNAGAGTTVVHIVGVQQANEYYNIKVGEILLGSYPSSASKEVSFTYSGDLSNKIFTIESSNDATAPVRTNGSPSTALSAGTTETTLSLTTNEIATCKYSTTAGTAYASMTAFTTTNSASHSTAISGLTNNTNYNYYVRCQDTTGNTNLSDYAISFSVNSAGGGIPFWMLNQINQNQSQADDDITNDSSDDEADKKNNDSGSDKTFIEQIKQKIFAYSQPRLKSLPQEQNSAKELKKELEKHYGKGKIPLHKKYWHTIVNPYIYGDYPIQAIIQAIKFGGKTVHPIIPFSAWQKAKDYLEWIKK